MAVPNHDPREARIRVIALDPPSAGPVEWDVEIPRLARLRGLKWAGDDQGWFASATTSSGVQLVYITVHGAFHVLRESPIVTWGVPSPDGRHLAFIDQTLFSNVWLIDGL